MINISYSLLRLFGYSVVPWILIIRTKKARNFLVYSHSEVFGVTLLQNNQKPTLLSASIFAIILAASFSRQTFRVQNKAKTLFLYVFKCAYLNYTRCFIGRINLSYSIICWRKYKWNLLKDKAHVKCFVKNL
jgi:hypothetical protein